MKWFGRKAVRDAPGRPFLLQSGWGIAGAQSLPRSYEAQVREAYLANPVAQRSVRIVAEAVGSVVVDAAIENRAGNGAAPPPPRTMSGAVPLPEQARGGLINSALLEAAATHLLLHGNAFLQVAQDGAGMPAGLFALRPERVTIEPDASGWPAAYLYKAGEARRRYPAADPLGRPGIVHVRGFHPLDDHYGLGCLGAAAGAVALHNAAARWNRALLDNAARPSGALVYDPGDGAVLAPAQFERLRAEMEAQFMGAGNAGRPMLLGLPGDNTYANYREAVRSLWRMTVLPMAGRILDGVAAGLGAWWPGLKLAVDVDQVSALHADRAELWAAVGAAGFLSDAEKREMLGFDPAPPS